jgi:hypothetical protein
LARRFGSANCRQFIFLGEAGNGFSSAGWVLVHQRDNAAVERLRAEALRAHHN